MTIKELVERLYLVSAGDDSKEVVIRLFKSENLTEIESVRSRNPNYTDNKPKAVIVISTCS